MFQNDYIMRQIENLSEALAKVIFQKDTGKIEIFDEEGNISDSGLLYHKLKKMVHQEKINEAENLLFEEIKQRPTEQNLEVAIQFYKDIHKLSDETLLKCNFSRQEIHEGIQAVKKIYSPV